jgi:hypothetical protein
VSAPTAPVHRDGFDGVCCARHPLAWPIAHAARRLEALEAWPEVEQYGALLDPTPVRFEVQPPRPRGRRRLRQVTPGYDARICDEGVVPTRRRSWHDLFNALVWATFPRTKAALHRRQLRAQRSAGDAHRRTREQDALALLDEGGVAMLCEAPAHGAFRAALDVRDLAAVADLVATGRAVGVVYGHAVLEHLALDGPPVRALVHPIATASLPATATACVALADTGLAAALEDPESFLDAGEMRSLPVRGDVLGRR